MFFRILQKDLQRKRAMNIILLLFIIMSAMFLASSASNLVTVFGAVDKFFDLSGVPDYIVIALAEDGNDPIEDFLECQTAHCGRGKPHFDFGNNISPIVRYRHLPQTLIGMTVDCCSLV